MQRTLYFMRWGVFAAACLGSRVRGRVRQLLLLLQQRRRGRSAACARARVTCMQQPRAVATPHLCQHL